jgi:putative NADH-flavin reductase
MRKLLSCFCFTIMVFAALLASGHVAAETESNSFKILVYGATGKVGSQAVNEALNRGHRVTAVSRDPSRITKNHDRLSAVKGDVLDPESVASLVSGQDVVIISVRGVLGKSKDPNDAVPRIAVENVVNALRDMGATAPRLIHVGGSGSLEVKPGVVYADTLPMAVIPRKLQTEIEGQVLALEYLRTVTDVDWTYATPAKNFTNGKRTGVFRIGGDQLLESSSGRSRISRADFAVALIDEVENPQFIQQRFSVVY